MGQVVALHKVRDKRARPSTVVAYLDLADPLCYLAAERLERVWPDVRLRLACGSRITGVDEGEWGWAHAARRAAALGIPLVPPDWRPRKVAPAQLAGTWAIASGRGNSFILAAMRLAYAGGYDIAAPETLVEAAAASGLGWRATLTAAADERWWGPLDQTTDGLRARGVQRLPALRIGHRLVWGEERISAYLAVGPVEPQGRSTGSV